MVSTVVDKVGVVVVGHVEDHLVTTKVLTTVQATTTKLAYRQL